ncbi:MAG: hypothetical protein IT373_24425 [Polyangiaceae bacterium]|nr:hypothetical protein [Polyangiaceae bacterium]
MKKVKLAATWLLAAAMVAVGVLHFVNPTPFVRIVPAVLPAPLVLVYLSGACEIAGGLGLLWARTRTLASWGLVALYVAVFPANVNMAVNRIALGDEPLSDAAAWGRLPVQLLLIAWAYWVGRRERPRARSTTDGPGQAP